MRRGGRRGRVLAGDGEHVAPGIGPFAAQPSEEAREGAPETHGGNTQAEEDEEEEEETTRPRGRGGELVGDKGGEDLGRVREERRKERGRRG